MTPIDFSRLHIFASSEVHPYVGAHSIGALRVELAQYRSSDPQAHLCYVEDGVIRRIDFTDELPTK